MDISTVYETTEPIVGVYLQDGCFRNTVIAALLGAIVPTVIAIIGFVSREIIKTHREKNATQVTINFARIYMYSHTPRPIKYIEHLDYASKCTVQK